MTRMVKKKTEKKTIAGTEIERSPI